MNLDENLGMDSTNVKTFQTRRYTADGEGTVSSVVATLLMGMISGAFFGILASVAGYYGFYLVIIVPLLIGAGIGGVMSQGVQITKNRDPWVTAATALSASLVAITTIHVCDYFSFLNEREQTVSERDIKDALSIKNQTRPLSGRATPPAGPGPRRTAPRLSRDVRPATARPAGGTD